MSVDDALKMIDGTLAQVQLSRADHEKLTLAINTIKNELSKHKEQ